MTGGRSLFTCPTCGKCFFYWVQETTLQPKVKCYFCSAEAFPNGEPPPLPAPSPAAPAPPAPLVAVPPTEGTPPPAS